MRLTDKNAIRQRLLSDPRWCVYALGDLTDRMFVKCLWFEPDLTLVLHDYGTSILFAHGTGSIEEALGHVRWPVHLQVREDGLEEVERHAKVTKVRPMLRMAFEGSEALARAAEGSEQRSRATEGSEALARATEGPEYRPRATEGPEYRSRAAEGPEYRSRAAEGPEQRSRAAEGPEYRSRATEGSESTEVQRLGQNDAAALKRLYADGNATGEAPDFFYDSMVPHGVFFGVYEGNELIAAAGTHLFAPEEHAAAVGNVYTRRDRRGRGLGRAVTAAVLRRLRHVNTVGLNVRLDNVPAIRIYESLGFVRYCEFYEAIAHPRAR